MKTEDDERTIHERVAALLDGDMDKAKLVLALIGQHVLEEAHRIEFENAPSLRKFGEWAENEARCRELAAMWIGQWAYVFNSDSVITEIHERQKEHEALMKRVNALLEKHGG
jgi:hypothetical protein